MFHAEKKCASDCSEGGVMNKDTILQQCRADTDIYEPCWFKGIEVQIFQLFIVQGLTSVNKQNWK